LEIKMSTNIEASHVALALFAFALGAGMQIVPAVGAGAIIGIVYWLFSEFMDDMCWRRGWR
jgi:hypothetical protein